MLNLMYITNRPEVAKIAESAGVDRIFVDMEFIGKDQRQKGLDTVKNHHTLTDVERIANSLTTAELLVRINPIHDGSFGYLSSRDEIDGAIARGAQVLMLPYFKTVREVDTFLRMVDGRAKTMLLVETPEAVAEIENILSLSGIDEVHIGLNDLSIGYGNRFMFELLTDGTVERLCDRFRSRGLPYGFGGIASLGKGLLPAERVITEHYRLGSTRAILSRSFCNTNQIQNVEEIRGIFIDGLSQIRKYEEETAAHPERYEDNRIATKKCVADVVKSIKE